MTPTDELKELREKVERLKAENGRLCSQVALANAANQGSIRECREAEKEVEQLKAELRQEREICLCGCPAEDHESYGEDGEACGDEEHPCVRVAYGVREEYLAQRALTAEAEEQNRALQQERDDALTALAAVDEHRVPELIAENRALREAVDEVTQRVEHLWKHRDPGATSVAVLFGPVNLRRLRAALRGSE